MKSINFRVNEKEMIDDRLVRIRDWINRSSSSIGITWPSSMPPTTVNIRCSVIEAEKAFLLTPTNRFTRLELVKPFARFFYTLRRLRTLLNEQNNVNHAFLEYVSNEEVTLFSLLVRLDRLERKLSFSLASTEALVNAIEEAKRMLCPDSEWYGTLSFSSSEHRDQLLKRYPVVRLELLSPEKLDLHLFVANSEPWIGAAVENLDLARKALRSAGIIALLVPSQDILENILLHMGFNHVKTQLLSDGENKFHLIIAHLGK